MDKFGKLIAGNQGGTLLRLRFRLDRRVQFGSTALGTFAQPALKSPKFESPKSCSVDFSSCVERDALSRNGELCDGGAERAGHWRGRCPMQARSASSPVKMSIICSVVETTSSLGWSASDIAGPELSDKGESRRATSRPHSVRQLGTMPSSIRKTSIICIIRRTACMRQVDLLFPSN